MKATERYVSPDGLLKLIVQRNVSETVLGFEPFAWTTSAEFLASKWGVTEEAAIERFLTELVDSRATIIAVARVGKVIRDVWIRTTTFSCSNRARVSPGLRKA